MIVKFGHSRLIDDMIEERDLERLAFVADAYYAEAELEDDDRTDIANDGVHSGILLLQRLAKFKNPKARIFEFSVNDAILYFVGTENSICRKLKKVPLED